MAMDSEKRGGFTAPDGDIESNYKREQRYAIPANRVPFPPMI